MAQLTGINSSAICTARSRAAFGSHKALAFCDTSQADWRVSVVYAVVPTHAVHRSLYTTRASWGMRGSRGGTVLQR